MSAEGRRVFVTGGSSGIGAATVERLAQLGYRVVFTYSASEAQARELEARLTAEVGTGRVRALACDLAETHAIPAALADALDGEPFYGLVHSAGVAYDCPALLVNPTAAERVMRVNFLSLACVIKEILPGMLRARAGRVVAVTSVAGDFGRRGNGIYSASKAAIEGYLRCVVEEVRDRGVTVNWVRPGLIDTRMLEIDAAFAPVVSSRVPMARAGAAGEIARVIAFLLSEDASYLQGSGVTADGGLSASLGLPVSPRPRPVAQSRPAEGSV